MSAVEKVIEVQAGTPEKLVPGLTASAISTANSFNKMKVCCTNNTYLLFAFECKYDLQYTLVQISLHLK